MKIFQVAPYFTPKIGGVQVFVHNLSRELVQRGHDVSIFTANDGKYANYEIVDGFKVYRSRTMTKVYNVPISPSIFYKLLRSEKPDILHAHQYPVFFSNISTVVAKIKGIPLLLHDHMVPEPRSAFSGALLSAYYKTAGKFVFKSAKAVITPSFAYQRILTDMGVKIKKIRVIPYGIELENFHLKKNSEVFKRITGCNDCKIILSVGRLNYQKGFQYLLRAMPNVLKEIPNAKLVIVGDGEQLLFLQNLSRRLELSEFIFFMGKIPNSELSKVYAAADIFVLPSIFESFGIVLIEAQAAGKPVVCTGVGGVPEVVVDNETGFIVEPRKPEKLADAIIRILTDSKLASAMGTKGRKYVNEKFDLGNITNKIIEVYEEVLDR